MLPAGIALVPNVTPPSMKVTLPFGSTGVVTFTVAVSVTAWPTLGVFGVTERLVAEVAGLMTSATGADVLAALLLSPL